MTMHQSLARPLFSLKWRILILFSLLLLGINTFTTIYFSRDLLAQFELKQKSDYAKQVKQLEGMVHQSTTVLLALSDIVPSLSGMGALMLTGNTDEAAKTFEDHWPALQLGATIDIAQIYDTRNSLIRGWNSENIGTPAPDLIRSHVQEVNQMEQPLTFLDCTHQCIQFAVAPMLADGQKSGVIVLGTTLASVIVNFKNVSGVDIGILNASQGGQEPTEKDTRFIANWHAKVSAMTNFEKNLPLLLSVSTKQRILAETETAVRSSFNGHTFEIHSVPIRKFTVRGNSYFVLIDDITESLLRVDEGIRRNIIFGVAGLFVSEAALLLMLWGPLSRLRKTTDLLPLLTQNAFGKIRQSVSGKPRKNRYKDEIDLLDETLYSVSQQLENLQTEVDKRSAGMEESNRLLGLELAERKKAEETIRKLNEELETKVQERTKQLMSAQEELVRKEKLSMLGQVAGSVGHELRNPLGVMSNAVYFLQTVLPDADEIVKEYLDIIKNEIAGSERIVSDLLDSVRIKPPQQEAVALGVLIEQTLGKLTLPSNVTPKLEIPETLPPLRVDAQQIHQVFRNLISNAAEAMPEGGVLEISAVADEAAKQITISVRDSGTGMTPEQMKKLFQPLFTTKARGIGLGLVVVKNLTEANGGRVEVRSEAGKGTVFTITLPAADEMKEVS